MFKSMNNFHKNIGRIPREALIVEETAPVFRQSMYQVCFLLMCPFSLVNFWECANANFGVCLALHVKTAKWTRLLECRRKQNNCDGLVV